MNQHASRPVAQGFPSVHRRMNGPIQSVTNNSPRTTPLRPSSNNPSTSMTNGSLLRRSLNFKSQLPIRTASFGTARSQSSSSSQSQQTLLRARALDQHRQNSVALTLQAIRTSAGQQQQQQQQQQQPIEAVFKVYEDKLKTDLGDFRAMCSRLILKEQEEKRKWHGLCLKMMRERDAARRKVSALVSERETSRSLSPSAASSSKRTRDDESSSAAQEIDQEVSSRSSSAEPRPIRNLRLSPISSPPGSPSASLYNSSIVINPSSSSLPSTSSSPPLPNAPTPCSSPPPPLNIITFNPPRSPNDKTEFDVFGAIDIPETRPVKRRKSYDSTSLSDVPQTREEEEIKASSGPSRNEKEKEKGKKSHAEAEASTPRPFLPAHTDIMYMPMKGRLFCRACLLDKTTHPSSNRTLKTFPTTVWWDELRDHCVNEHPKACADVARLCPADLNELRRRLYAL